MSERGSYRATYSVMIDSREFRALSSDARLVLHTLKNSRINNMAGIFVFGRGEQITISEQAGISSLRVNKTIDILSEGYWIYYCLKSNILWVRNQLKFDPWVNLNNENHKIAVGKVIAGLPKSNLIVKFCKYYDLECPFEIPEKGIGDTIKDTPEIPSAITDPDPDPDPEKEKEAFLQLSTLKIKKLYFDNLCKEFPTVDHEEELRCAELYRQSKPGKGKSNDHLFLRNWFKGAIKFKEKNNGKGKDLSKYDGL